MTPNNERPQRLTLEEANALIRRQTVEVSDSSVPPHPKLSVLIITYNHVQFIAEALDGVLMQQADFPYEIVIGEDHSTDGTAEIVLDYQKRHPEKIRVLLATENFGKYTGNGRLNFIRTLAACRGEYIAILEGDDCWIAPNKIQLQVHYLDQNGGCAICHHKVEYVSWPGGEKTREFPPPKYRTKQLEPRALAMFNYIQTCSVVFRRKWMPPLDEEFQSLKLGDWPLFALLNQHGWIGYLDRNMARYRVHPGNGWNNRPAEYKLQALDKMARYLSERVNESSRDVWEDTILAIAFKDSALAARSLAPVRFCKKLAFFAVGCVKMKKPFWVFNRLWAYYDANILIG